MSCRPHAETPRTRGTLPLRSMCLDTTPVAAARAQTRMPLPEGTLPVGFGLLIAGISSYAFFIVGKGALGEEAFKPVASLWFATYLLAPGFFLPLEQEVGRAIAHRRALGQGGKPVVRRVIEIGAVIGTIVSIVVLSVSPFVTRVFFEGNWLMTVALIMGFLAYAPAHLARGICSGSGRFGSYAIVMGADGLMRIVLCGALAVASVQLVSAYGFVVAVAPLVGVVVVYSYGALRTTEGPPAPLSEVTPNLGWLLVGTVLAAALVNAGPLTTDLLASSEQAAEVTRFANAVLLARVPLFLFQAVQAALLPRLARLAAQSELDEFRLGFRRLMVLVLIVGVTGTTGAFLVGPFAYDLVFGGEIDRRTLTLLALGSSCYMVALATAQAVIALQGHAFVALGWVVGMGTFAIVTALAGDDLFLRVELGLVAGSSAAMVAFGLSLRSRLRAGARASGASILEAVTDFPHEA
jgi:O-antigen/teichoic acid export membrane protein